MRVCVRVRARVYVTAYAHNLFSCVFPVQHSHFVGCFVCTYFMLFNVLSTHICCCVSCLRVYDILSSFTDPYI